MSVNFIKSELNKSSLTLAKKQQEQLLYFTKSEIQGSVELEWSESFRNSQYVGDNYFYDYMRSVLLDENFKSIVKHLRKPLPSTTLINNEILPSILKVLDAEDSRFDYYIGDQYISEPLNLKKESEVKKTLNSLYFRANNLKVTDINEKGEAYTYDLDIKYVKSLEHNNERVTKIAFSTAIMHNGEEYEGVAYMDDSVRSFYTFDEDGEIRDVPLVSEPLSRGVCPVDFIGTEPYDNDFIVKKHPFSNLRTHLERYVILSTLEKINDLNGTFPISASIKAGGKKTRNSDNLLDLRDVAEMDISHSSKDSVFDVQPSPTQAGSAVDFPIESLTNKETGEVNMTILQNLVTYFHIPVDILAFIKKEKKDLERYIVATSIGTFVENKQEGGMSELHVGKTYDAMEDRLRAVSQELSLVLNRVGYNELSVKHDNVVTDIFCGSKFYMMSVSELYEVYKNCPNPIEKKNILTKISNTKNLQDPSKRLRDNILYSLLPYSDTEDFNVAREYGLVNKHVMRLQLQFSYYISRFEAKYGSILGFWKGMNSSDEQKTIFIQEELIKIIKDENIETNDSLPSSKDGNEG